MLARLKSVCQCGSCLHGCCLAGLVKKSRRLYMWPVSFICKFYFVNFGVTNCDFDFVAFAVGVRYDKRIKFKEECTMQAQKSTDFKAKIQKFGSHLSGMVMPNIGAFIAWGLITALFIPTGWLPNETMAELVSRS